MPSFDVVSDFDGHEATNAVDQANREVNTRFDFKGTGSKFALEANTVNADQPIRLPAPTDVAISFEPEAVRNAVSMSVACKAGANPCITGSGSTANRDRCVKGFRPISRATSSRRIKASKLKVQAAIQGDKLRVSGKKRDDLQTVIALLKDADIDLPLQYENFRD